MIVTEIVKLSSLVKSTVYIGRLACKSTFKGGLFISWSACVNLILQFSYFSENVYMRKL